MLSKQVLWELGTSYMEKQDWTRAVKVLEKLFEICPTAEVCSGVATAVVGVGLASARCVASCGPSGMQ